MSTNDRDLLIRRITALDLTDESASSDNIQSCNTKKALRVVDALALEDLSNNWDRRVNRVRNDENVCLWRRVGRSFGQVPNDGSIGVEKVVTSHAWLAGNTGGDEDDFGAL